MRKLFGIKIGGLQFKIFTLILLFIAALISVYVAISIYQQNNLSNVVQDAGDKQKSAITSVSENTMQVVLDSSMSRMTGLQAYIADDLFADVQTDVLTLRALAEEIFAHADSFEPRQVYLPDAANDGIPSVQMMHEEGVDPAESEALGLVANMSEVMLAMFESSNKLSSCFVATTDGCIIFVDDRAGSYFSETGELYVTFPVSERPWYKQAAAADGPIFTGVEPDSYTGILGLVCAAPVYYNGELVAVVGADIFLTAIEEYVRDTSSDGGFLCVINENGQVLFSPEESGPFKVELDSSAPDLRQHENQQLSGFVTHALQERTQLTFLEIDGKEYYAAGAPMETLGWAVISVVKKDLTDQPTEALLSQYGSINDEALTSYRTGARRSAGTFFVMTIILIVLAITGALVLAHRIVKPLNHMTKKINSFSDSPQPFEMEDTYRTGDEIEVLAESFATLSKKTSEYFSEILKITAEKERIGTELELATRIQADMLPNIFPAFPDRPDFDVYATMDPAKEVGGDFYDFFLIDDTHLGLVVGDVSGKGVPAALFMMVSKILVQNYAMTGLSPKEVLKAVNDQICSNNREEMFVTVWFGVLDTVTGKLTAANAGHEYPVIMHSGGKFEILKDKHGLVIGAMEGIPYKEYEIQLESGSKIFLYTDGVPEANNAQNEMFGMERMLSALNAEPLASPERILKNVRASVDAFVKDAEQFDDLTMLCAEFVGPENDDSQNVTVTRELTLQAVIENSSVATDFIDEQLEACDCPMKAQMQLRLAVDELFTNIASYAYGSEVGDATIRFSFNESSRVVTICFMDKGVPFDPLESTDPDVTLSAEERPIGGLGIFLVKKTMDAMDYRYENGMNILTIQKQV